MDAHLTLTGQEQAGQQAQDRRFAGTGRPYHRQPLALLQLQVNALEYGMGAPTHAHIAEFRHRSHCSYRSHGHRTTHR
jgi:hypothetical protein